MMMMEPSIQYILTAVLYGECLLGLTVNLIILATNFMKWKSLNSLQTCDKILSSLAISRGLYHVFIIIRHSFTQFLLLLRRNNSLLSTLQILSMFLFYSGQWIATILCVFYCVKIVTYKYKLIIFLKTRISTMAPWLILASLLLSLISSLPFGSYDSGLKVQFALNGSTENMMDNKFPLSRLLIFAVGSYPPFIIFCVANFLLIHFLLMHTRRMGSNGSHIQSPNLQSHFNALKSMSLFLLLQILFLISVILFFSGESFSKSPIIDRIILSSPPLFHSLYIVSSSREARKMLYLTCHCLCR